VARNAVLNLAGLGVPLVVAFITLPILIRYLGTERFGVLALAWMLLTYLAELGFGSTTTRYAAEALGAGRGHELGGIAWTTAGLQALAGLAEGVALAMVTPWLVGSVLNIPDVLMSDARTCLYLLAAAIPLVGLGKSFRGLVEAAQRFDLALLVHLPITAGTYVLAAIGAVLGWPLPAIFGVIVASRIISLPGYLLVARHALPGISLRPAIHRGRRRELTMFAGWVAVSTIVSPLLVYLDRFMVGVLLSMTAVTFYAAPYELVARLALIPAAIVGALFPVFSQLSGERDRTQAESLAARSITLVVVVLGPAMILILGGARDGLSLWLGPEYASRSALALQILAVGVLANAAAHVPYGLLQGMGRPDLPARFHLIELPLQLLIAWVLVSRFGIPGAALAWTGRVLLDAALLFGAGARLHFLGARSLYRHRLPLSLAVLTGAGAVTVLAAATLDSMVWRLSVTAALAAGSAALLWAVAVPEIDRRRIALLFRPGA
jgi:O-antigen/teichoic acid export membrane protein